MNENTIVFVSAYEGDKHQVEANLSVYLHHECPVVILSPANAPITSVSGAGVHCMWMGDAGWAGSHTLVRHRKYLEAMLSFPHSFFLMHDADSICLSPELPAYVYEKHVAFSNEVADLNAGTSHLPKIACQPPYFFSRVVLEALLEAAKNPPESYYGEVTGEPLPTSAIDHYHWQLTYGSKMPHRSFCDGASWETTSELGLTEMARKVREDGSIFIHQIKTSYVLDRLMAERAEFLRSRR